MTQSTKDNIIRFILSGLFFASSFTAFDLWEGERFSIWEFLIKMFLFGIMMVVVYDIIPDIDKKKRRNIS